METIRIRLEPMPRIYKPLADLKYHYHQLDRTSTINAEAAASIVEKEKLPLIKTTHCRRGNFSTTSREYVDTINDSFKIKLKRGVIADKISSIELKMRDKKMEYQKALSKHEIFAKLFRCFLDRQYDEAMRRLLDLQNHEQTSKNRQDRFERLQKTITEKSLKIYEMENEWRDYKRSELFLRHALTALQNDWFEPQLCNFNVDPPDKTPTLDERIANFETYPDVDTFQEANYHLVTAEHYAQLLARLKRQNFKILGHKLQSECLQRLFVQVNDKFENDTKNKMEVARYEVDRLQTLVENQKANVNEMVHSYEKAIEHGKGIDTQKNIIELKNYVEELYKKCLGRSSDGKSHLQMAKYLEEYCDSLLNYLYSFDLDIVRKVLREDAKKKLTLG